jgi:hypothetical protein
MKWPGGGFSVAVMPYGGLIVDLPLPLVAFVVLPQAANFGWLTAFAPLLHALAFAEDGLLLRVHVLIVLISLIIVCSSLSFGFNWLSFSPFPFHRQYGQLLVSRVFPLRLSYNPRFQSPVALPLVVVLLQTIHCILVVFLIQYLQSYFGRVNPIQPSLCRL